jgi:predicted PurR-regulated permease PerM
MVPAGLAFRNIALAAIVVAILFLAREVILPVVLALFLTFVLTPLVGFLQRLRFPRPLAVICSVTVAFAVVFALSMMVVTQLRQLSSDLPRYQVTLGEKIHELRETFAGSELIKGSAVLKNMTRALNGPDRGGPRTNTASTPEQAPPPKPLPVEVHQPDPSATDTLVAVLSPLIAPITTTAIIVVFVMFFLLQREDLRNRFIRLAGTSDLERTTTALDDAGQRLARFFVTQLIVNSSFGIVVGAGLALIAVPSAPLWGLLAAILRFVPYLGAPMAAVLPLTLAAAVGPDWHMVLWTVALFVVVELLTGQLVEPLAYGQSAGLSPVAVIVAAAFWAWLWGPLGLLISTPLTLCLVVTARHVEGLQFIDIMLGDQPALTHQQAAYQRMLAGDPIETIEHAHTHLKDMSVEQYYEDIMFGALALAQQDAERGRLDDKRLGNIVKTVSAVVEDFNDRNGPAAARGNADESEKSREPAGKVVRLRGSAPAVVCLPGMGKLDEAAAIVVADALIRAGVPARPVSTDTMLADCEGAATLCLCFLEELSEARMRYTVRRLAGAGSGKNIVVALLGANTESPTAADPASQPGFKTVYTLGATVGDVLALMRKSQRSSV